MNLLKKTESICPECLQVIDADIYEEGGKVYIKKTCPEHGEYSDLYWGDYDQYIRAINYAHDGNILNNPRTEENKGCPYDCGICNKHKSTTTLGIIDVTNRCNLRCPICFAHAGAAGYLYEPTMKQIEGMMENLLANDPVWTPALQLSGGEPTVRDDLPEIVEMAKDLGFVHVEVNSNGIKMAESADYCLQLKRAGVDTVYLQFDGVTPGPYVKARGFNLLPIKLKALENLKSANFFSVVLVPVLVKGINDQEIGDIIRFAIKNRDVVRAINFQPVAITGRIDKKQRESMSKKIPDLMINAEKQTDGFLKQSDWFPIPAAQPLTTFLGKMKNEQFVDFCSHEHCGMASYLFLDGDEIKPITSQMKVDETLQSFKRANEILDEGKEFRAKLEAATGIVKNIKFAKLSKYVNDVILHSDYLSLNRMHHQLVLIGAMHFMDPYNFDLARVQKCVIHYATPDGRIIPFCTMNNIHRPEVEKAYAQPIVANKMTPLYDVNELVNKIVMEESQKAESRFIEYMQPVPMKQED